MFRKLGKAGLTVIFFVTISMILFQAPANSFGENDPILIEVQVSPSTLNLQNQGEWVTIHTDIAYGYVVGASVMVNGIPISWWKSDNQGNFVAKFVISEVKDLVKQLGIPLPALMDLTLWGLTNDGSTFEGTQTITVIDVMPVGSGKK